MISLIPGVPLNSLQYHVLPWPSAAREPENVVRPLSLRSGSAAGGLGPAVLCTVHLIGVERELAFLLPPTFRWLNTNCGASLKAQMPFSELSFPRTRRLPD